jgi:hypothetical protein
VVPETTADGKSFLRIALICAPYELPLFIHPGQNKTVELLKCEYWWYRCNKNIKMYVSNCKK